MDQLRREIRQLELAIIMRKQEVENMQKYLGIIPPHVSWDLEQKEQELESLKQMTGGDV